MGRRIQDSGTKGRTTEIELEPRGGPIDPLGGCADTAEGENAPQAGGSAAGAGKKDLADLRVAAFTKNMRVLMAHDPEGGERSVRLQVPAADNFTVGMVVPCCRKMAADLWQYLGRCPRWKGRW